MYKLLIVDDEPKIRSGLRSGYPWEELGFIIAGEAANGSEALDFIAVHPVDVILTDVRMPVLSGIDLVIRLREQKNRTKVILLSGYREFEYAQKAVHYGVYDYLVKPTGYYDVMSTFVRLRNTLDRENPDVPDTPDDVRAEGGYYDKLINAVYSYVGNNISDASLEGAACAVNRSIYHLSRLFKQHTGQNFSDYVMSKKMERAALLLSGYHYEISEVSYLLGYDSAKNFSKAFKAYYGRSPREYRCSPKNDEAENA